MKIFTNRKEKKYHFKKERTFITTDKKLHNPKHN